MRQFIKGLFTKDWTIYEKVLCIVSAASLGMVVGFVFSPIKKGVRIFTDNGCNNGCNSGNTKMDGKKEKNEKKEKQNV